MEFIQELISACRNAPVGMQITLIALAAIGAGVEIFVIWVWVPEISIWIKSSWNDLRKKFAQQGMAEEGDLEIAPGAAD